MGKEWTLAMEELTVEGCGTAVQAPKDEAIGEQEEGDSLPSSSGNVVRLERGGR